MSGIEPTDQWLFSYGTLRLPNVQMATFHRRLDGEPDSLSGYDLTLLTVTDPMVVAASGTDRHPILRWTGNAEDEVQGMALAVTRSELEAADRYEVSDYKRVAVTLRSGRVAFVYVAAEA